MHPLEEKDSSPLEDKEITRLIKVSREVGYKKQDKIPERNLVDFKPTSIMQIANSSDQRSQPSQGSGAYKSPEVEQKQDEKEDEQTKDQISLNDKEERNSTNVEPSLQNNPEQKDKNNTTESLLEPSSDTSEIVPEQDKIDLKNANENEDPKPVVNDSDLVESDNVTEKKEITDLEKGKQEGIEIGKKIAFEDLENEQQRILESLRSIVDNIKKKEAVDKTELTKSILGVVTRLASERAGYAIEDNSEPFKNRIISFVEKIEQASKRLVLNLNPKDIKLIKKNLVKALNNKEIEIRENSDLFRGDFILQMGSMEIGDLISEQISTKEKSDVKTVKDSEIEIEEVVDSDKEMGSEPPPIPNESQGLDLSNGDEDAK